MSMKYGQRILIVDDDENMLTTSARVLLLEGYDVRSAASPLVALSQLQVHRPSAILLDFRMPFINGIGFLYRLRSLAGFERTPVAIMTADVDLQDDEMQAFQELGATVYFKPIWIDELVDITRSLLTPSTHEHA